MNNISFELINLFLTVSKFQSFSQAGNYLYLDPSTVSKKIHQLEKYVGQTLFIRNNQGVALTVAGLAFKPQAEKLLKDLQDLDLQPEISWNILRIGMLDNIAAYQYAETISHNLNKFKRIQISVKGIELVNNFNDGYLDAIIINEDNHQEITGSYVETKLYNEAFGVITKNIKLPPSLSLSNLEPAKLIIAPRYCPVSQQLLSIFNSASDIKQIGYTNTLLELVANGDYFSILPWHMIKNILENGSRFHATKLNDFPERTISLFSRTKSVNDFLISNL